MFKNYSKKQGIILVDIILAFSLSIVFVVLLTESSIYSRQIFEKAKERNQLLKTYEDGRGAVNIQSYGNEMFQTDFTVATSSIATNSTSTLQFTQVLMRQFPNLIEAIGTPLCSVDFRNGNAGRFINSQGHNYSNNNPIASITPIVLPISYLLPLTDLEVRNGIAYISGDSSTASDPDLFIVDIHNANSPTMISSINTGPGISGIALVGKRIFVAAPSTVGQFQVIRLDGLSNPILEKKYKLALPYATATPVLASSIFYHNDQVFLGTEKWNGDELNIINISNPLSPIKVGGIEIDSKVNDIYVNKKTAYVAASNQNQLLVANINDSANPVIENSFGPSGWQRQEGKVISYFEDNLNFGRTSGGYNIIGDHETFTWSTTSTTTLANPISTDIPGGVYGIVVDRTNIYLATRNLNKEFQIFDRQFLASTSETYSLPVAPQAMTCDGEHLYILAHTAPIIYDITFK